MVSDVVEAGQLLAEQISEFSSSGLRGDQSEGKELLMLWVTGPSYQEAKHVCSCEGGARDSVPGDSAHHMVNSLELLPSSNPDSTKSYPMSVRV